MREEERLKELSKYELFLDNIFIKDKTARQILVSAYNKLERQQKEIKKEKSRIMELAGLLDKQENEIKSLEQELEIQKGCSISKDKIMVKINERKNNIPYLSTFDDWEKKEYTNEDITNYCIEALNELLEEK